MTTTTPTASLTERYIAATVRSLPEASRADVRAELEASIADAVEARVEQGEDATAAERAVLTDLGDPAVLAAGYADRPLHLIGPRYYVQWWRLLKLLWIIVPICAFGGVVLGQLIAGAGIGEIIGTAIGATVSSVAHVAFWVTLVFVILERTNTDTGDAWDVDRLPEPATSGSGGRVDLIASLTMIAITAAALLWDRFIGFVWLEGRPLPVLDPDLWPVVTVGFFILLAAEGAIAIAVHARGRWTAGIAVANTVVAVLFMSLALTMLGRGLLVNPEFLDLVFTANGVESDVLRILGIITAFGLVAFPAWDIADGWIRTSRDARS